MNKNIHIVVMLTLHFGVLGLKKVISVNVYLMFSRLFVFFNELLDASVF